ncbi:MULTISPECIES: outer membrane protein assembly factor BamA [Rhizobium]|uniref:Outer membrane protein assembly factor BamA n=1 Tax=Rhizobium bangladeshense TaxID=1138189 RepID=A0ABS7LIF9_9HYPH|nr:MULTISPECIES: outer membrane protein assembly factor BamA [Rhizobium]MBX4872760.1 outer membrane protein assembly factor BamA [Rhizobium bangladeshense]MBX4884139.1 outer membrane protein assembly factor BamA [Rhizobium bangladeshense]MBX4913501.1 outer membrane protein assembly factor BamA [Rhizobium bangladeshense]MBX4931235.1 outer membrane protein assembly factor BamA [Rhizobium bangladeshense]MBY3582162.1 outer membrane protein assembly factor BamA [Rhizobium bangladeshense]
MKAGSRFLNAVSAVALSAGVVASGAGALTFVSATAAEAAVIQRIDVRGASRVGAEAVRSNLTITPGKSFSNTDIDNSVKQLYGTGYFSDVKISVSGGTLVVNVQEAQLVNQVVFNGNRKIKDDKLATIVQTRAAGPYSDTQIQSDIQAIKDAYAATGRSEVEVTTQVVPLGEGRVNLAFVINEGDRTKIDSINFVGNNAYSAGRLAAVINTKRSNFLSFLTRKDVYNEDKLHADEEALRQFYYNRGYADMRIVSSDATFDEATNKYTLTFNIEEGQRYDFGPVTVQSTVEGVGSDQLLPLVRTKEGQVYSAKEVQKSIEAISDQVASAGYPFARVTPRGNRDLNNNTIGVEYLVDQGERAYVERIEIRGNSRTRDYVIRREFDMSEGDAFNQQMITKAKRRLEALGYFSSVNISTQPGSSPDRVVVVVDVQDQSTGSFGVGAGYAAGGDGLLLEASIEEKNFLGRGQYIRISAGGGQEGSRAYGVSFTEPYFLGYRLAAGFDVNHSETSSNDDYDYEETSVVLRVTAPITEDLATTFRYNYKQMKYDGDTADLSATYANLVDESPWTRSSVSQTLTYNTLDDTVLPREGIYATATHEIAGLGGDSQFYKIYGKARYYHLLADDADIIGSLSASAGYVIGFDNNLNVFDQFTLTNADIRGFENKGIGPRIRGNNDDPLGGTTYFTASAEATFPMPGFPRDFNLRGAVFADAGTLFGNDVELLGSDQAEGTSASLRASVGVGVVWQSPFGALRLDYAIPVLKEDFDKTQNFKFGINNQF